MQSMYTVTEHNHPVFASGTLHGITKHSCSFFFWLIFIWFPMCVDNSCCMFFKEEPLLHIALEHALRNPIPSWNAGPIVHSLNGLSSDSKILGRIVGESGDVGSNALITHS